MYRAEDLVLLGDFDPSIVAHQAIPLALQLAERRLGRRLETRWLSSVEAETDDSRPDALWCVPGSPYRSTPGALRMIGRALAHDIPYLGTCGGMQYGLLAFAHQVMNWPEAAHAEEQPEAHQHLLVPLQCARVEVQEQVTLKPGSRLNNAYGAPSIHAGFHCRYGVPTCHLEALAAHGMQMVAWDGHAQPLAFELTSHSFFVGTLFQPEREALVGAVPPLVLAWLEAAEHKQLKA